MQIVVEAETAAPPEIAYAVNLDIARWPDFVRGIETVEMLTPGPVAVGTRFRETRTMFGRTASEEMTVAALDPPLRQALTAENNGVRYEAVTEFIAIPGGTKLRLTFGGTPVTLGARIGSLLAGAFAGAVRKQLQNDIDDVAAEAARRAALAS